MANLKRGKNEALLMILLVLMPQLKSFTYQPKDLALIDPANPPLYLLPFIGAALGGAHGARRMCFNRLSNLSVLFNPKCADHISILFRLPSLRRLRLETYYLGD